MATAESLSLSYSAVLDLASDTLWKNLDLQTVGNKLINEKKLSERMTKRISKAVKKNDSKIFYALLATFDIKSFVVFLEAMDDVQDEKHEQILTLLSHDLRYLSLEATVPEDVKTRLQSIIDKYFSESCPATTVEHSESEGLQSSDSIQSNTDLKETTVHPPKSEGISAQQWSTLPILFYKHPVETALFGRAENNAFYSSVHDIEVMMKPEAFPEKHDTLSLSLTVNDYSLPVQFPDGYHGMYSVLLSLKCDPHVEVFRLPVTVTVPHSAVGSLEKLCVLAGAEEEDTMHEDPTIRTVSVDDKYLTFQTLHFSKFLLVSCDRPPVKEATKQRQRVKNLPNALEKTISFNEALIHPVLPPLPVPRSYSCPASDLSHIEGTFFAVLFFPRDTSSSNWQFIVTVTNRLPTHAKELLRHVSQKLDVDPAKLRSIKDSFTFSGDYVELCPSQHSSDGWTITAEVARPSLWKNIIKDYWYMPPTQREDISLPCVIYDVYKSPGASDHTSFSIELKKSKSLLDKLHTIVFRVPCYSKQLPLSSSACQPLTSNQHSSIKIIREMYDPGPEHCRVVEGLSGGDCSQIILQMDDRNCCTLLCEISFQLFNEDWQKVGLRLGLEQLVIDSIQRQYGGQDHYIPAFKLFSRWLCRAGRAANLKMLVEALNSSGFRLTLSSWTTSYATVVPRSLGWLKLNVAHLISCYWRFVARFLGMPEWEIDTISKRDTDIIEQTVYMLIEWNKHHPEEYVRLFKSVHCLNEHIEDKPYLRKALNLLE